MRKVFLSLFFLIVLLECLLTVDLITNGRLLIIDIEILYDYIKLALVLIGAMVLSMIGLHINERRR